MQGVYKRGKHYWIRYAGVDGEMIYESCRGKSKAQAQEILITRKKAVIDHRSPDKITFEEITFKKFSESYLEKHAHQKGIKQKTLVVNQLIDYFGGFKLMEIGRLQIENYLTRRRKVNKNLESTVNRHLATLQHMFTKASEWNNITKEHNELVHKIKQAPEDEFQRKRFLSVKQIDLFLEKCKKQPHLYDVVVFALHTGCRLGEILNLTWEDNIDLVHGYIMLNVTKPSKQRILTINADLKEILERRKKESKKSPNVFQHPETGKKLNSVKHSFETARNNASLPWLHFHDLRHTVASHLAMNDTDLPTIKELLGHGTMEMTLRYAHLTQAHKNKAVNKLTGIYNPPKEEEPVAEGQPQEPVIEQPQEAPSV